MVMRLLWSLLLATILLVSGCKPPAPLPPLAPAWSLDVWTYTTIAPPPAGDVASQPLFDALYRGIPFTNDFIWEQDQKNVIAKLPEIYALMDAAPQFASLKGATIDSGGAWIIDGKTTAYRSGQMTSLNRILRELIERHENLADLTSRDRVQGFAVALIALGTELADVPTPVEEATILHLERVALVADGCRMLEMLDKSDGGHRLTKPMATIEAELNAASRAEADRRREIRDRAGK
ncbi:MAG: hypothetical protein AABZ53_09265 [Planctomycetota bacterium]